MILTEANLQAYIHTMYEGDSDTPTSSDDDYLVRRKYLNLGIAFWESWRGTKWKELYTTLTSAADGTKTAVTNATQANCPTDLVETLGYVQIADSSSSATNYIQIDQNEAQLYIRAGSADHVYYMSGKPGAYKINWNPIISSSDNGKTIDYPYYKRATLITATSDTPEPSDHLFLVHYSLHWLYKEENPGMSREHLDISISMLNDMKLKNDMEKPYQDMSLIDKTSYGFGI